MLALLTTDIFDSPTLRRPGGLCRPFQLRDVKRQRAQLPAIDCQVDGVFAEFWQSKLLDQDHEMRSHCPLPSRELHRKRRIELRHDDVSVFIREGQRHSMLAFLNLLEPEPARDRALRMRDRRLE